MIKKVNVFGAGTMGRGIAHVAALSGYEVIMKDVSLEILNNAVEIIRRNLQKGIELGKLDNKAMNEALDRISLETDVEKGAEEADLIFEAIIEKIDTKLDLFRKLDSICKEATIFASNTSALSVTELAGATSRADRFVGTHFFNPAHIMRLVEVVKGLETSSLTIDKIAEVIKKMGKDAVIVNDSPGFATSRINVMIGNEAFYMLQEGVASAKDIDKALKLGLNHPMGPFELIDLVGLDIRLSVLKDLHSRLGEKFRPCPLLEKYVKAGRLGRKVGRGVYEYENTKIKKI